MNKFFSFVDEILSFISQSNIITILFCITAFSLISFYKFITFSLILENFFIITVFFFIIIRIILSEFIIFERKKIIYKKVEKN